MKTKDCAERNNHRFALKMKRARAAGPVLALLFLSFDLYAFSGFIFGGAL